jgi:hypothetical protein
VIRASAQMILVELVTIAAYIVTLEIVVLLPGGIEVVSPLAEWWTGAWLGGAVFGAWNLWDSALDARDAYRRGKSSRIKAGGIWRMRSDLLQCVACVMMVAAGCLAIVQWSSPDVRTALILVGGLAVICNQAWNRIDRERVTRMPSSGIESRAMERLAQDIAADARLFGHEFDNIISLPVGTLEILRVRPGTTREEAEQINASVIALLTLAEHVHALHQRIKAKDPSTEKATTGEV